MLYDVCGGGYDHMLVSLHVCKQMIRNKCEPVYIHLYLYFYIKYSMNDVYKKRDRKLKANIGTKSNASKEKLLKVYGMEYACVCVCNLLVCLYFGAVGAFILSATYA